MSNDIDLADAIANAVREVENRTGSGTKPPTSTTLVDIQTAARAGSRGGKIDSQIDDLFKKLGSGLSRSQLISFGTKGVTPPGPQYPSQGIARLQEALVLGGYMSLKNYKELEAFGSLGRPTEDTRTALRKLYKEAGDNDIDPIRFLTMRAQSGGFAKTQSGGGGGGRAARKQTASIAASLKQYADENLQYVSEQTLTSWARQVEGGRDPEDFKKWVKAQAKSEFPLLSPHIDSGGTVREWADRYVQVASDILEVPPESINLSEPKFRKALDGQIDKDGRRMAFSLADWATELKRDPTYGWEYTSNAREAAASFATQIAQLFGSGP